MSDQEIEMHAVKSSMIKKIGYLNKYLLVQFNSGPTYAYENVSNEVYQQLIGAKSIGQYFYNNIRNADYNYVQVA